MHHYTQGKPTRQGHKGIPEGQYEEEQGRGGFYGPVSHLLKDKPSTRWSNIEGDLKPRMFTPVDLTPADGKQRLLYNADVTISQMGVPAFKGEGVFAHRNADADTVYFCHKGRGQILTEYGALEFAPGTYVMMQKCLTHVFVADEACTFFNIESHTSAFTEPDRGIVGRHAPWDMNALGKPDLDRLYTLMREKNIDVREIRIQHSGQITKITYDEGIFDVRGWKGDLFPFTLKMEHIMPIMSHRVHLPPSVHSTFVARNFVVCSFLPRPFEQDEDALRVPFYHQNIDYDEVLFYHDGDFFSRDNLKAGMMSLHPAGFPHGPHPKAFEKVKSKTHTDEYAVMIDTRWPLKRDEALAKVERLDYWKSWMKK